MKTGAFPGPRVLSHDALRSRLASQRALGAECKARPITLSSRPEWPCLGGLSANAHSNASAAVRGRPLTVRSVSGRQRCRVRGSARLQRSIVRTGGSIAPGMTASAGGCTRGFPRDDILRGRP
ncbi:hypothetical protein C8Q79DRAFT_659061 [Trametes meyenii]|nr:hypothetical protein C8Q79DRAFT_659061 [Trametes meyenii]